MSTATRALQAALLLRTPWQWRRNDGGLWAFWLDTALVLLLLGAPAVAMLIWWPPRLLLIGLALLASMALLGLWAAQFATLLRLDHPHAARLVPGHSRALRRTALGLWLVMMALCGSVAALAFGLHDSGWRAVLLVLMGSAAALLAVALLTRWWWLWAGVLLFWVLLSLPTLQLAVRPMTTWLQGHWQAQPLTATALALVAMAVVLSALFGNAQAAHARAYAGRERVGKLFRAGAAGQQATLAACGRWGEWLGAPLQRLADAWLARVIAGARNQRSSVMARAEVVLQGARHWVLQLSVMLFVQLLLALSFGVLVYLEVAEPGEIFEHGHVGMSICLASLAIAPVVGLPGVLWATRREQALLMLLPGMPQGSTLNRALAWQPMRHYLLMWAATLPAFMLLAWLGKATQVLPFLGAALPLAAWLWRDASRLRAPRPAQSVLPYLLWLVLAMSSLLLLRWQPAVLLPWLLAVLGLSAGLLLWRWRRLAQMPQALPAGRLA